MPRAPSGLETKERGRAVKTIDWNKVDDLLMAGCSGVEIAPCIGVCMATLYERCQTEQGVKFSHYAQSKRLKGESLLKAVQYEVAVKKKNVTMLMFLGKTRLKQTEGGEDAFKGKVDEIRNAITALTGEISGVTPTFEQVVEDEPPIQD